MSPSVRLPRFAVERIVAPLTNSSSRPLLVETPAGRFVLKLLQGADGPLALAAEWIGTALASAIGLPTLEIAALELDPKLGGPIEESELREEIERGAGLCLGVRELKGARPARAAELAAAGDDFAVALLWLDVLLQNPDRRADNPNVLAYGSALVAIDHAAALPFHHDWQISEDLPARDLAAPRGHVFADREPRLREYHLELRPRLPREVLEQVSATLPFEWLGPLRFETPARQQSAYAAFLWKRLQAMDRTWAGLRPAPG